MFMKDEILAAIVRLAEANGGKPLGVARFEKEAGISPHDWGRYWPRFSAAQTEAGFRANGLNRAFAEDFLIERLILLIRKLGKFPTAFEMRVAREEDPSFPEKSVFERRGPRAALARRVLAHVRERPDLADVAAICEVRLAEQASPRAREPSRREGLTGEVYLLKSGRHYKIGKSRDATRRRAELRVQLPEPSVLLHVIKTDDPAGVEAYWHKRFAAQRKNGEWFDLSAREVAAFRRWRRIA